MPVVKDKALTANTDITRSFHSHIIIKHILWTSKNICTENYTEIGKFVCLRPAAYI